MTEIDDLFDEPAEEEQAPADPEPEPIPEEDTVAEEPVDAAEENPFAYLGVPSEHVDHPAPTPAEYQGEIDES